MNIDVFCEKVEVRKGILLSKSIQKYIVSLRQIYCFVCREYYKFLFKQIAFLTDQNHATVIHSVNKVKDLISIKDKETIRTIEYLGYEVEV